MSVGYILKNKLNSTGISQYRLANDIGVYESCIGKIIKGSRRITVGIGLKLAKYFGNDDEYWILEQVKDDIKHGKKKYGEDLRKIEKAVI